MPPPTHTHKTRSHFQFDAWNTLPKIWVLFLQIIGQSKVLKVVCSLLWCNITGWGIRIRRQQYLWLFFSFSNQFLSSYRIYIRLYSITVEMFPDIGIISEIVISVTNARKTAWNAEKTPTKINSWISGFSANKCFCLMTCFLYGMLHILQILSGNVNLLWATVWN